MDGAEALGIGLILHCANQLSAASHFRAAEHQTVDEGIAALRDICLQAARVDADLAVTLADSQCSCGGSAFRLHFLRFLEAHAFRAAGHYGCETAPFHRAVGPVGCRPEVGGDDLAFVRRQAKAVRRLHLAFEEGNTETDRLGRRRRLAYPMESGCRGCIYSCRAAQE